MKRGGVGGRGKVAGDFRADRRGVGRRQPFSAVWVWEKLPADSMWIGAGWLPMLPTDMAGAFIGKMKWLYYERFWRKFLR
jgi:hypothetical protein